MVEVYSTHHLAGIVRKLSPLPLFFSDTFFKSELQSDKQEVLIDYTVESPRIMPWVHPLHPAVPGQKDGYVTRSVVPGYMKKLDPFTPEDAIMRMAGEPLGGELGPEERLRVKIVQRLASDHKELQRAQELMAAQAIIYGAVTVEGPGYKTPHVIDFQRDAALTIALTGTSRWNDPLNVDRGEQMEDWSLLFLQKSGVQPTHMVVDPLAWKLLRKDPKIKEFSVQPNAAVQPSLNILPSLATDGLAFKGWYGEFPVYVYSHKYIHPLTGVEQDMMPANTVVLASTKLDGVRHYGCIRHMDHLRPERYFAHSYLTDNPSIRYLMMETAPLFVPRLVNASMRVTVV